MIAGFSGQRLAVLSNNSIKFIWRLIATAPKNSCGPLDVSTGASMEKLRATGGSKTQFVSFFLCES